MPIAMALKMGFEVGLPPPEWWSSFLCNLGLTRKLQATKLGVVTIPLQCTMISTIDVPCCLSSKIVRFNFIIDAGASACILPHQSDFAMYGSTTMKIKDISSSNQVAVEGLIHWSRHDATGTVVTIELMGYHIPKADVCLLSPQVLIWTFGGHALLTNEKWTSDWTWTMT